MKNRNRQHQPDTSGRLEKIDQLLYYEAFRHYFDHAESVVIAKEAQRQKQQRVQIVNYKLDLIVQLHLRQS